MDTHVSGSQQLGVAVENQEDAKIEIAQNTREEVIDFWITLNSYKLELIREGQWKKC